MGRRVRNQKATKAHHEDEIEDEGKERGGAPKLSSFVVIPESSDDEEANEDLSLKIVEKARSRAKAYSDDAASAALTGGDVSLQQTQDSDDVKGNKKLKSVKKIKVVKEMKVVKKIKKQKKMEVPAEFVDLTRDEEKDTLQNVENMEITKLVETSPIAISDNVVLKKLLRGPRYFDPQDGGWNTCYNCGEEGHKTVNCTLAKRRKPCFVCGSLEHNAKQCSKGHDCFICNKGGHRAKACPEKYKGKFHDSQICLKCGGPGHDMFSCKTSYSADDLKEISCYICKSFGHLCCADNVDPGPSVLSCYRCGEIGHNGLECGRSRGGSNTAAVSCYKCGEGGHLARECQSSSIKESGRSRGESNTAVSCYKCGEKGHFARECPSSSIKEYGRSHVESNTAGSCYKCGEGHLARECQSPSVKTWKKHHESATPAKKMRKLNRDYEGNKSVPQDFGRPHKRKISQYDEGYSTPSVSMNRGGWNPEQHHGDMPGRNGWRSPTTPSTFRNNYYGSAGNSSYTPSYNYNTHQYGNSTSNGSDRYYQRDYSAQRYDNSGRSDYGRRSNGW